jgi:ABC-type glutathione transport system ATPase component
MNRIISLTIIFVMLIVFPACSGKKPLEQSAVRSKNVLAVLREMNASYEKKNLDAFLSDVSNDFTDRETFAKSLTSVFAKYDTVHFNVQYGKMVIMIGQKGEMKTTFTWNAEWLMAGGASVTDGGRVTLVFEPEHNKLVSIEGKNPFLAQPGETPGKQ